MTFLFYTYRQTYIHKYIYILSSGPSVLYMFLVWELYVYLWYGGRQHRIKKKSSQYRQKQGWEKKYLLGPGLFLLAFANFFHMNTNHLQLKTFLRKLSQCWILKYKSKDNIYNLWRISSKIPIFLSLLDLCKVGYWTNRWQQHKFSAANDYFFYMLLHLPS